MKTYVQAIGFLSGGTSKSEDERQGREQDGQRRNLKQREETADSDLNEKGGGGDDV